jgi:hypothetical protein
VCLSEQRTCDFCGRSEIELLAQAPNGLPVVELDEDGLWVCGNCRTKLVLPPVGEAVDLPEGLDALVGESAGAICYTLNLPYEPPYRSVIDAAVKIAYDEDRYMSAWSFVTQWPDGTTVWRAEDGGSIAVVAPNGSIRMQHR